MEWNFTFITVPVFSASAIAFGLSMLALRRRYVVGSQAFAVLMLAASLWAFLNGLENAALNFDIRLVAEYAISE